MYYTQQYSMGTRGLLIHYGPQRGFLNNNNQMRTNLNLTPPDAN